MPQYSRDINIEKSTSGIQTRVNLINATVFIKASHKWRSQLVTYDKNTILPYTPQRQLTRVGRYTHTTHFSTHRSTGATHTTHFSTHRSTGATHTTHFSTHRSTGTSETDVPQEIFGEFFFWKSLRKDKGKAKARCWLQKTKEGLRAEISALRQELGVLKEEKAELESLLRTQEEARKLQVQEMQIEIDLSKLAHQVAEITQTEYFQQLQAEVEYIRNADCE